MSKNIQQKNSKRSRRSWTMPKPPSEASPVHTPKPTQGSSKPESSKPTKPTTPKPQADKPKK